ncbi:MAG: hypothetical protein WD534_03265 [Phycisphaeraceae bacterium]
MATTWAMLILIVAVVLVLVFPVGVWLFWWGWRGRPQFGEPRCGKCGYDLRTVSYTDGAPKQCPECGADLGGRGAVRFGTHRRRPAWMIAGAVLAMPLLLAVVVGGGLLSWSYTVRSSVSSSHTAQINNPAANRSKATAQLITDLATTADEPWTWQELERRHDAGNLSPAEVEGAVAALIAHLQARHATAPHSHQPLHWVDTFLQKVRQSGELTDRQLGELYEAFYGPAPEILIRPLARPGQRHRFTVSYERHWNLPGVKLVYALREVRREGQPLPMTDIGSNQHPDERSTTGSGYVRSHVPLDLPPGEYELVFVVDAGVMAERTPFAGRGGMPGQAARWVSPAHVWTYEVPVTVRLVEEGEPIVPVVTDAALGDLSADMLSVERALVRAEEQGVSLHVMLVSEAASPHALSYRVRAELTDGTSLDLGRFLRYGGDRWQQTRAATLPAGWPADVNALDLHFEPDVGPAEQRLDVFEVWGRPHVIRNVPVERYDGDGE